VCRLKKDILTHLTEVAAEFRRKADANLAPTTKRLLLENYQLNSRIKDMFDEIELLQQQSVEWKAEDKRQINHMRELRTANALITNRNITIKMVGLHVLLGRGLSWPGFIVGVQSPPPGICPPRKRARTRR